jgi:hypothetical protein
MFIKINIRIRYNNSVVEVVTSSPTDCFGLLCIIDKSKDVVTWNMEEYKPEYFGWAKGDYWERYSETLFK